MSYAEMYAYSIGQCGVKPAEYWQLTEAETIGIIAGHQRLQSYDAEKFRNVFDAIIKGNGAKGDVKSFWPLPTDYDGAKAVSKEYLESRNKAAIEFAKKMGIFTDN